MLGGMKKSSCCGCGCKDRLGPCAQHAAKEENDEGRNVLMEHGSMEVRPTTE